MSDYPTKEERKVCWGSKDRYWECLDKYAPGHNSTSDDPEPQACIELRKLYVKSCPAQWVVHFDRKRTYEKFKRRMEKGYEPLDNPSVKG
ncbi:cytochrome c oxidase assembly factor 6 homolog [Phlebotomus argentipes]|uniref:cytochrome c oxidase assembly factor 6 homolog n=1 Tax=Phlebotomus argentipes TaxID=94469 RepID=UPI0028931188|nr:cytochrome c oxidase assembly factor 6 homolog [Phlebotomus argentipes]